MTDSDVNGYRRGCVAYLHRQRDSALVTAYLEDGSYYEDDTVWSGAHSDAETLGAAIQEAFYSSEPRKKPAGHVDRHLSDWPSLKASKARSGKQFEHDFVRYDIFGANGVNIVANIESQAVVPDIQLMAVVNPRLTSELGRLVQRLHRFFLSFQAMQT